MRSAGFRWPATATRACRSPSGSHQLVLPAIVLGVVNSALILRFTRASMLDVLGEDHIRTARAKGAVASARVVLQHACATR